MAAQAQGTEVAGASAREPLHGPTPFVEADSATGAIEGAVTPSLGELAVGVVSARRAAALGFPSTAAVLYRDLVERSGALGSGAGAGFREVLRLGLVTALMDDGRFDEAGRVLAEVAASERGAQWELRAGLLAAERGDFAEVRRVVEWLVVEALPDEERAWGFFLRGLLAEAGGAAGAARGFFEQAEARAVSPEAQARFALARVRGVLRVGEVSEAAAAEARRNMERLRGRTAGLHFARTYAAILNALGRRDEAVGVLQQQLIALPAALQGERDEFQLLLGLIAGAGSGQGRATLRSLVASGSDPAKQRAALGLLAQHASQSQTVLLGESSRAGGGAVRSVSAAGAELERDLEQILATAPEHPILDDLLLLRAQLALEAKRYAQAERDARALLEKFPGSQRKAEALGVLMGCAWEQFRYRAAADFAAQSSTALLGVPLVGGTSPNAGGGVVGEELELQRFWLGVLVAEAWYRARDYPNAADAYAAVLARMPSSRAEGTSRVPLEFTGDVMFQRVLAEVEAGRLEAAQAVLDTLAEDSRFDPVSRWQAEWNVARALQRAGRMQEAYLRVRSQPFLFGEPPTRGSPNNEGDSLDSNDQGLDKRATLPPELQARMRWLQARLSLLAGDPEETLRLADALTEAMPEGVGAALAEELRSSCALLKAEAFFRLGRREAAVELLQSVREGASRSNAAVQSLIVEAGYYAGQGQSVEAQQLYTKLADDFPDNPTYAPYARYQAALQAERRGQDANLEEANKLIEQMVTRYPQSPLVFYARLKQGDLLRKLNQFPQAQQVYESLVNNYPQHPDVLLAQLALAECHNAQSMNDPAHANRALVLFEQLRDRVDAPVDVRVEAGLNLGYLMLRGGQPEQAEAVWWRDVVSAFLLDEAMAGRLGVRGRYWMTRTLLEVGALYERQARIDQARAAWELIIATGLPGAVLAEDRLARAGGLVGSRNSGSGLSSDASSNSGG